MSKGKLKAIVLRSLKHFDVSSELINLIFIVSKNMGDIVLLNKFKQLRRNIASRFDVDENDSYVGNLFDHLANPSITTITLLNANGVYGTLVVEPNSTVHATAEEAREEPLVPESERYTWGAM